MPYLNPNNITPKKPESKWFTRKMMSVLIKQGQIEPLQIWSDGPNYFTFEQDAHGSDIVYAARALGWPTLSVYLTTRYEE